MSALILVTGDGEPKLLTTGTGVAYDEALELLKRGVKGHFQLVPFDRDALDSVVVDLQRDVP